MLYFKSYDFVFFRKLSKELCKTEMSISVL
jgi:hypothetical protein